ncbi:hypothetical protein [Synechococcus sp. UW105]|uniref:hypothetical protein n=1 Tax=Synechococcus sp. UW105 TaxID=337067 RepID=UPI000E0FD724|nr:hypothetical protein [Synechococcus sp. UW105]
MPEKNSDKELSIDELKTITGAGYSPEDDDLEFSNFVGTENCNEILGQDKAVRKISNDKKFVGNPYPSPIA